VGVYEDPGALETLASAWDGLARTPMQQSIWARAWAQTMGKRHRLRVSTAGPPDHPSVIGPFVSDQRSPVRLELLGSDLHEPMDVLGDDENALAAIAGELAGLRTPLVLRRVPAGSPFVSAVCEAYTGRSLVLVRRALGTPYLPLDEGGLEPERGFSALRRSDFRSARKRAEPLGGVTAETLSPGVAEAGPLLDEALRLARVEPLRADFYRRYAESAARRGILRLSFLRVGGRAAAVQLAVAFANRFWSLKTAYDQALARCLPDKLLMLETIRYAVQNGLEQYELLGERAAWTGLSTLVEHESVSVRTYTPGLSGLGALAVDGADLAGRRLRPRKS
jgi:CelD/BcsL family acetyltransferase involved in cellulose biosynthesis